MKLHKRLSVLLSMGIMGIGLITFKFEPAPAAVKQSDDTQIVTPEVSPTPLATPSPTPEPTPTPIPNDLQTVKSGDVYDLVVNYAKAKLTCDKTQFEGLVTDTSYIDEEDLQFKYATVRDFEDFTCYTKRGVGNIDFIVYYTYLMDIATVETKGISIDKLYVTTVDGKYIVYSGYIDDSVQAELNDICSDDDVQELIGETYEQMSIAMEEDPDFLAYIYRMYYGSDPDPEVEDEPGEIAE